MINKIVRWTYLISIGVIVGLMIGNNHIGVVVIFGVFLFWNFLNLKDELEAEQRGGEYI